MTAAVSQPLNQPASAHEVGPGVPRRRPWRYAILCGLVVLAARIAVVLSYAGNFPMGDQWRDELDSLYIPWASGQLGLRHFFVRSGEHYQVLERTLNFLVTYVAGEWNTINQACVQAIVPALTSVALVRWYAGHARATSVLDIAVICAAFALPIPYFNILIGNTSVYTLSILFACCAAWLATSRRVNLGTIAALLLCLVAGYLSLANGIVTVFVAALAIVLTGFLSKDQAKLRIAVGACLAASSLIAYLATPPLHVQGDAAAPARAGSLRMFWMFVGWPHGLGYAVWSLPLLVALAGLRRPVLEDRLCRFGVTLAAWILLTLAGMAMVRGFYDAIPARYWDFLVLPFVVGVLMLANVASPRSRTLASWTLLAILLVTSIRVLPAFRQYSRLYRDMAEIETQAIALESLEKDAGLRWLQLNANVVGAMYDAPLSERPAALWTRINHPVTRALRPKDSNRFVTAVGRLFMLSPERPECSRDLLVPPESLTSHGARSLGNGKFVGDTTHPTLYSPAMPTAIRNLQFDITSDQETSAHVYFISRSGLLINAFNPARSAIAPGLNHISIATSMPYVRQIRLDPGLTPGTYSLSALKLSLACE